MGDCISWRPRAAAVTKFTFELVLLFNRNSFFPLVMKAGEGGVFDVGATSSSGVRRDSDGHRTRAGGYMGVGESMDGEGILGANMKSRGAGGADDVDE